MPPSFLIIDDGWQQTGPDSVGIKKSSGRLEAKKDVILIMVLFEFFLENFEY